MTAPIIDEAAGVFADPKSYADEPRPHSALTHLRAHAPVSLVDSPPYRPFWAITKHTDIMHLAFGYGGHFCLGPALARTEVNSFFTALLPRLKSIELNGNPELISTTFVGGLKYLPIRYEVC